MGAVSQAKARVEIMSHHLVLGPLRYPCQKHLPKKVPRWRLDQMARALTTQSVLFPASLRCLCLPSLSRWETLRRKPISAAYTCDFVLLLAHHHACPCPWAKVRTLEDWTGRLIVKHVLLTFPTFIFFINSCSPRMKFNTSILSYRLAPKSNHRRCLYSTFSPVWWIVFATERH